MCVTSQLPSCNNEVADSKCQCETPESSETVIEGDIFLLAYFLLFYFLAFVRLLATSFYK